VVIVGTLVPFVLLVMALQHAPAPRVAVVATLEPVLATAIAWVVHDEALAAAQILGGMLVVAAVAWVQSHPPAPEVEAVPAWGTGRTSSKGSRAPAGHRYSE
jgi:drug/metabolite transporter (DMT)-like permease